MLLIGKTQEKHAGDLPPTVPDLPSPPLQPTTVEPNEKILHTMKTIVQ